jgi:hypothetical protein
MFSLFLGKVLLFAVALGRLERQMNGFHLAEILQ